MAFNTRGGTGNDLLVEYTRTSGIPICGYKQIVINSGDCTATTSSGNSISMSAGNTYDISNFDYITLDMAHRGGSKTSVNQGDCSISLNFTLVP